ncbi:hypothetical protein ACFX2I_022263 [Malus domestica]
MAVVIAHFMHKHKSGWNGVMTLKLVISKAYDSLEWNFLEAMMRRLAFSEEWICLIMNEGGLGLRDLYAFNIASLSKQAWRFVHGAESLAAYKVSKAKYFPNTDFLNACVKANNSYCWKRIAATWSVIRKAMRWQVETEQISGLIWHHEKYGRFSVLSAYHVARQDVSLMGVETECSGVNRNEEVLWRKLWGLEYLGRSILETIEHIFWDCDFASAVWFAGMGLRVRESPLVSFREWLSCAAQEMSKSAFDLCLPLVSNIWGARNALLWNGKRTPPNGVGNHD